MAAITYPTAHRGSVANALSAVRTVLSAALVASSTPDLAEAGVLTTAKAQEKKAQQQRDR